MVTWVRAFQQEYLRASRTSISYFAIDFALLVNPSIFNMGTFYRIVRSIFCDKLYGASTTGIDCFLVSIRNIDQIFMQQFIADLGWSGSLHLCY